MIEHVESFGAPRPGGPYSHAVRAGGLVFLAGQRPVDPKSGLIPTAFADQVRQVFTNLQTVLADAGCVLADVAKVNTYLSELDRFDEYNAIYREYFDEPYPARTTVGCTLRGIQVEVDVVAAPRTM